MGKLFCLVPFIPRNKSSRPKVMREDMCFQETMGASEKVAQLNNSVEKLDLEDPRNLTSLLQQKNKFANICTRGNERIELECNEQETELDASYLENHRSVSDGNFWPLTNEASEGCMVYQGHINQVPSIDSVADRKCVRVSSVSDLCESAVFTSADQEIDAALFSDRVPNGHTGDHGGFQINYDTQSVSGSSFSCSKCIDFSPEAEFNSSLAEASRVDDKDPVPQFQSGLSQQLPSVAMMTCNENVQEISQLSHNIADSDSMFRTNTVVPMKSEVSCKIQSLIKHKSWWKIFIFRFRNMEKKGLCHQDGKLDEKHVNHIVGYTSDICDGNVGKISNSAGSNVDVGPTSVPRDEGKTSSSAGRSNDFDRMEHGLTECQNVLSMHDTRKEHCSSGPVDMLKDIFVEPVIFWPSKDSIVSSEKARFKRVEDWINNIDPSVIPPEEAFEADPSSVGPNESHKNPDLNLKDGRALLTHSEIPNASVISLNAFSTVAVFPGIGLKEMPLLGMFSSLKTLNISGNCIERITPGSLPRSLHVLDLSRNRIAVVEGLRDLTRLRIIDLSYNRISRIGHGLANCTLTKELYLSGNNISDVEGLHRLSKLSVLDLGFNKLTTSKSLGQLAANYSSLLALNLLGNPVHTNFGEERLRRLIITLVPRLAFLNKQPMKTISAREAVMDNVARVAMGSSHRVSNSWRTRKLGGTSVQKSRLHGHGARKVPRAHGNSGASEYNRARHHLSTSQHPEKIIDSEKQPLHSVSPCSVDKWQRQRVDLSREQQGMPRSRSEGVLCDQNRDVCGEFNERAVFSSTGEQQTH